MMIFKPDGNIYGLASCACAENLHMKDEFQPYILSFSRGLRQVSYLSVFPPFTQQFLLMVIMYNISTHYIYSFVLRKGGEQCSIGENITPHESIL